MKKSDGDDLKEVGRKSDENNENYASHRKLIVQTKILSDRKQVLKFIKLWKFMTEKKMKMKMKMETKQLF